MATSTTSTADAILLNEVEPEVAEAFNKEVLLFDLATKSKTPWMGRKKIFDVQMGTGGGVGARSETGALPAPGAPTHAPGEIYAKRLYGTLELSHDLIEQSRGSGAAFREALADNLEATLLRLKKHANFCAFGDGRGILATVASASNGATLTGSSGDSVQLTVDTTRYVATGDKVAFWTSSSGTSTVLANGGQSNEDSATYDGEAVSVKSVDSDTLLTVERTRAAAGTATFATNNVMRLYMSATTSGALVYQDPMGLRGMADDGTIVTTFEGISRTTYPKWKGVCLASGSMSEGSTLAKNHFLKLAHRIHRNSGMDPDIFIMDPSLLREFLVITDNDVRYAPVNQKDPGYDGALHITIGGKQIPLFTDFDCPYGVLYGFPKSKLEMHELSPLQLDNSNGAVLKQGKPYGSGGTGDIYYAYFRAKFNWATRHPFAFGVVTGLSYAAENA
jgi:hypothetical protein